MSFILVKLLHFSFIKSDLNKEKKIYNFLIELSPFLHTWFPDSGILSLHVLDVVMDSSEIQCTSHKMSAVCKVTHSHHRYLNLSHFLTNQGPPITYMPVKTIRVHNPLPFHIQISMVKGLRSNDIHKNLPMSNIRLPSSFIHPSCPCSHLSKQIHFFNIKNGLEEIDISNTLLYIILIRIQVLDHTLLD